jgi:1-acyl-sn-glycerol-3-phosphate acyltransferase
VPVNRGKRGQAIRKMLDDVAKGLQIPGQLIIYPQGTRVAPGADKPYKVGTGLIYEQLGQPCYPAATNVGVFWPKRAVIRRPGRAVVEFLPPIPVGVPKPIFMEQLASEVERRSDALMIEAGFPLSPPGEGSSARVDEGKKLS